MSLLEEQNRHSTVLVTTKGRKTAKPHTVKIWFVARDGKVYLTSARGMGADWVKNLRKNPEVTLGFPSLSIQGQARWLEGPEVKEKVLPLFFQKYFLARIFRLLRYYRQEFAFEVEPQKPPGN